MTSSAPPSESVAKLRIDKWLWYARVVKSRSLAQKMVAGRKVRVNSEKVGAPSYGVKVGDVLTVTLERRILVLEILVLGTRRGPAVEAQTLYKDLSPPVAKPDKATRVPKPAVREAGSGRPTKKQRRSMEQFLSAHEKEN